MPAAIIGGAIAAVGAVGSAVVSSSGARSAANATTQAADRSADVIQRNYDLSSAALRPWQQSGLGANAMLNDYYGINPGQDGANSQNAFRSFIQNSDYGFQFGQGSNRVNSGYAGAGTLKSGAAMRALEDYRQNLQQGYRGEFLAGLGNQQALGASAASAQAGVSQNAGNSLANVYTQQGNNIANARLVGSQNTANAIGSVANTAGYLYGRYG